MLLLIGVGNKPHPPEIDLFQKNAVLPLELLQPVELLHSWATRWVLLFY